MSNVLLDNLMSSQFAGDYYVSIIPTTATEYIIRGGRRLKQTMITPQLESKRQSQTDADGIYYLI